MGDTIARNGNVLLETDHSTINGVEYDNKTELSVRRIDSDTTNPLAQIKMFGSGTNNYQGVLAFETINSGSSDGPTEERMRIHTNGNVGIGTTEPDAKLSINGGLHVGGDSDPGDNNLLVDGDIAISGKHAFRGNDGWLRLNQDKDFASGVHTPGVFAPMSLNVGGVSNWGDPGGGNVWIKGNVGIGTTPQEIYKLDVRGYNMLTDPGLNYNSHFPYKNNCAYITGSKVYIRGGKPDGWKKCLTVDGASGWTRIGDGSSTNNIQFEPQSGFHRVAFNELRFWDWDTKEDMVIFKDGNVTINGKLKLPQGAEINEFSTDGTLSGNSDSAVPTGKAVRSYVDKIQSGTCSVGKIDGDGDRIRKKTIFFKPNFSSTPKVVLGVTNLDVHRDYNLRYIVNYEDLTEKGFTIIFKTWSNTYIYGGRVQWMAYGRI